MMSRLVTCLLTLRQEHPLHHGYVSHIQPLMEDSQDNLQDGLDSLRNFLPVLDADPAKHIVLSPIYD